MTTAQIYKDTANQWRYRIKADNGEIIATGESYHNYDDCFDTVSQLAPDRIDTVDQ